VFPCGGLRAWVRGGTNSAVVRAWPRTDVRTAVLHPSRAGTGDRARYIGERKNLFDLRRVAVVHNLHVLMRQPVPAVLAA